MLIRLYLLTLSFSLYVRPNVFQALIDLSSDLSYVFVLFLIPWQCSFKRKEQYSQSNIS